MKYSLLFLLSFLAVSLRAQEPKPLRAGIIGLDTSHVLAFTASLNKGPKKPEDAAQLAGVRVVAAYPQGSRDIEGSTSRVPEYTAKVKDLGVEIVDSIEELMKRVDVVFLESNDGRVHLEQLQPVLAAHKPVFVDKPIAADLPDVLRIIDAVRQAQVPFFCSSSLRFGGATQAVAHGSLGKVQTAETFSPAHLEPTHVELYWYGIHGCESLCTVMGPGCKSAKYGATPDGKIEVTGTWADGRTGIFREENGQDRKGYGGKAVGEKGESPVGSYDGYDVLLVEIVKMFRGGPPPVSLDETLELYAFMKAAEVSKQRGGAEVTLQEVIASARQAIAGPPAASGAPLRLAARERTLTPGGAGYTPVEKLLKWDPKRTAVVICDMWDHHTCPNAEARVGELAPRIDAFVKAARAQGVFVIHCPSNTMPFYRDHPGRKLAESAPKAEPAVPLQTWCKLDLLAEAPLPIDDSDGGCDCPTTWKRGDPYPWTRQNAAIEIAEGDAITDSAEAYNLLQQRGIENVMLLGVHLNMCVLGRPFAIRQLVKQGKHTVLVRDLTDTMYNPAMPPHVTHFAGTQLMVEHVEKYWCPTIASTALLGGEPFHFAGAP